VCDSNIRQKTRKFNIWLFTLLVVPMFSARQLHLSWNMVSDYPSILGVCASPPLEGAIKEGKKRLTEEYLNKQFIVLLFSKWRNYLHYCKVHVILRNLKI